MIKIELIEITSIFYLKFKESYENDILLVQLFGPVLFSAHIYGSFAAAGAHSLSRPYVYSLPYV